MRIKNRLPKCVAILLLAVLMMLPGTAAAQDIFADLAGIDNVESTYISGRFAHNMKRRSSSSGEHTISLEMGFSSYYSYQCYSERSVAMAKKILKKYLKDNPTVEVVMHTTQGVQEYTVYEKFIDGGNKMSQLLIWDSDNPCVAEISVINWDKGLDRTKSKYVDSDNTDE
ncbi:MAG: hypothetical protein PUA94_05680 [Bacteroidales bacterium]|nr:hypothetical protein [Bacteroidales bacterium]